MSMVFVEYELGQPPLGACKAHTLHSVPLLHIPVYRKLIQPCVFGLNCAELLIHTSLGQLAANGDQGVGGVVFA